MSKKRKYDEEIARNHCNDLPNTCLVCDDDILRNSVLFHCECVVAMCNTCACNQIAAQVTTYSKGLICPICRQYSDNIKGVEACQMEENTLILSATNFYNIRVSRHDDGIIKTLEAFFRDNLHGTISRRDLKELSPGSSTPMLRLEVARLEQQRLDNLIINDIESDELPLGPMKHLNILRNYILEKAIESQFRRTNTEETKLSTDNFSENDQLTSNIFKFDDSYNPPISEIIPNNFPLSPPLETTNTEDSELNYPNLRVRKIKNSNNNNQDENPLLAVGSKAVVISGALTGQTGKVIGYTLSGDSVRLDLIDGFGKLKRTAVLRKNVKEYFGKLGNEIDQNQLYNDSSNQIKDISKYCLCDSPKVGIFIPCSNGIGCNGWVHPKCCYDLKKLPYEQLNSSESVGYICPKCRRLEESQVDPYEISKGSKVVIKNGLYTGFEALVLYRSPTSNICKVSVIPVSRDIPTFSPYSSFNTLKSNDVIIEIPIAELKLTDIDSLKEKKTNIECVDIGNNTSTDSGDVNNTGIPDELGNWVNDYKQLLPVLIGESITKLTNIRLVKELYDKSIILKKSILNNASFDFLFNRLEVFIKRLEVLDKQVSDDLSRVLTVLNLQEGQLENEIRKRNVMEKKIGHLLNITYENHTKLGIRCTALQSVLRILAWCSSTYKRLTAPLMYPKAIIEKIIMLKQAYEFKEQVKKMPVHDTFETIWGSIDISISTSNNVNLIERNKQIFTIVNILLEYWRKKLVDSITQLCVLNSSVATNNSSLLYNSMYDPIEQLRQIIIRNPYMLDNLNGINQLSPFLNIPLMTEHKVPIPQYIYNGNYRNNYQNQPSLFIHGGSVNIPQIYPLLSNAPFGMPVHHKLPSNDIYTNSRNETSTNNGVQFNTNTPNDENNK